MEKKKLALIPIMLLMLQGCAVSSQTAEKIGVYDLSSQRLSGKKSVVVPGVSGFTQASVLVTVGTDGKVMDARIVDNWFKADPAPALAAARDWTFRPQFFDGKPIQAVGVINIAYDAPEIPADTSVPFPESAPSDTEIVLERSACFGTCPDYRVSIRGDGKVRFSTNEVNFPGTAAELHRIRSGSRVLWAGTNETSVSAAAVAALISDFRKAHFMGLKPEYAAGVTDSPTYALTLRIGSVTKRVTDYVGNEVGMPASVTALENAVDELAGAERWVSGNAQTIELLKARGFDFKSRQSAELVLAAIQLSNSSLGRSNPDVGDLIRGAVAEGMNLAVPVDAGDGTGVRDMKPIGTIIAGYAARIGDESLFYAMADMGQLAAMGKKDLNAAFVENMGCSAGIAKALVAAGASPNAQGPNGNALHAMRYSYDGCSDVAEERVLEMVRTLITLGVPLEARDSLHWTPLMGCDNPAIAQLLLKAGADPNARSEDGTTPILSVDDDRVALLLLRAGADPRARNSDRTVRQQADRGHWPGTLAWLDANGFRALR